MAHDDGGALPAEQPDPDQPWEPVADVLICSGSGPEVSPLGLSLAPSCTEAGAHAGWAVAHIVSASSERQQGYLEFEEAVSGCADLRVGLGAPGSQVVLSEGERYWVEVEDVEPGANVTVVRDVEGGSVLAASYAQSVDGLTQVQFLRDLGLGLRAVRECQVPALCVTTRVYNGLMAQLSGDEEVPIPVGAVLAFEAEGHDCVLGHDGGSWEVGPVTSDCLSNVRLWDYVTFGVLCQPAAE